MNPAYHKLMNKAEADRLDWLSDPARTHAELALVAHGIHEAWVAEDDRLADYSTATGDAWLTDEAIELLATLFANPSLDEREASAWLTMWAQTLNDETYDLDRAALHWLQIADGFAKNQAREFWLVTGTLDEGFFHEAAPISDMLLLVFPSLSSPKAIAHLHTVGAEVVRALRSERAKESMRDSLERLASIYGVPATVANDMDAESLRNSLTSAWNVWVDQDFKATTEGRARLFLIRWLIYGFFEPRVMPWHFPALRDLFVGRSGMEWPLLAGPEAWEKKRR